jgi:NAD(P)-dependent dehydrogenase (short-subunit alcohol dehydrogenase family)
MKKALITGGNRSIGFETARQLLQKGFHVYMGSRDLFKGMEAVDMLKAEGLTHVKAVHIDIADEASIINARVEIGSETEVLDVLINNAGINGGLPQTATGTDISVFREVFETNVFGLVLVTQSFMDLLKKSEQPRIVNVSSGGSSLTLNSDPSWKYYHHKGAVYPSSKAALNMYTIVLAYELRDTPFKVNAVDPGFTSTDFNQHRGTGSVEEAAARLVKYAVIGTDGPTGKFISEEHNPETGDIPW